LSMQMDFGIFRRLVLRAIVRARGTCKLLAQDPCMDSSHEMEKRISCHDF
jgi:hypothetical protein